ncbi:MAG TPA: hypothetical protein PLZ95_19040, partial [Bryobacteraceae bacterium]|nr:hypothetical protein [Bryobacteraceae bacterium]
MLYLLSYAGPLALSRIPKPNRFSPHLTRRGVLSLFLALALAPQAVEPNPTPAPSGPMPRPDGESLAGRKPILPDAAMCRV